LIYLDADSGKLRNAKDSKNKTPQLLDDSNMFKDLFETVWDAAKAGNVERLKQLIKVNENDQKPYEVNAQTPWQGNTPLLIAVKNKQLKVIKLLIWELNAGNKTENYSGLNAIDFCKKFIKDEATRATAMGLLTKMH
jgi:ankyrin repeat protein